MNSSSSCRCHGAIPRNPSTLVQRVRKDTQRQGSSSSAGNSPVGSPVFARSRGRARYSPLFVGTLYL